MPFYERQPYIQPLHQILGEMMRGDIRIPRFQRPGTQLTWRPEQRGDLLDSLYRGFPVGTILLWSTPRPIPTLDVVGGFKIPLPSDGGGGMHRLLLDGHQRLSTLAQILGGGLIAELQREGIQITREAAGELRDEATERWMFELSPTDRPDGSRDRFVLLKPDQEPTASQVPLDIVLDRASLNRWIRTRERPLTDDQIAAADGLRDRLREYAMPVAVLVANSLKEATESFKRINSSGTPMSDFHMVAALAFDSDSDPQQQFAEARSESLEPIGWGAVSDSDVLRVCAGLARQNPARLEVDELADKLRGDINLIPRAFQMVAVAAELLRGYGVHGPEALPYAWQLITLAVYLGRSNAPTPLTAAASAAVGKWFWLTTYGEVFAGGNSAVFDRSILALGEMFNGGTSRAMERDISRRVRPVSGFDFRSARSKACALAMARHEDGGRMDGSAHRALATGVEAMQVLVSRGHRSTWWHLAVVTPEHGVAQLRDALKRAARGCPELGDKELLAWLGVAADDTGDAEALLGARRDRLLGAEKTFVSDLGLEWASVG